MKKIISLMLLLITTNIFSQEMNDDYLQDELTFENPYSTEAVQEQEELEYQYNEPSEYFLTEEEVYNAETDYNE